MNRHIFMVFFHVGKTYQKENVINRWKFSTTKVLSRLVGFPSLKAYHDPLTIDTSLILSHCIILSIYSGMPDIVGVVQSQLKFPSW